MRICIVGGGTAGWMAANLFAHHWTDKPIEIVLVESPEVGIVGVGEGSTPTLKRFFEMLGIAESDWMSRCNATYKVNIKFAGWSPQSGIDDYSHPFISQLDTFSQGAFFMNCRTRRLGLATHTSPADFLLNGVLAQQNKGPITPDHFPFRMEYGYHFDSYLLGDFLKEHGKKLGVIHKQAFISGIEKQLNGDIKHLLCTDGERISAELFIDCSGFSSLLMQQQLGVKFKSYHNNLFNDAAVVMPSTISSAIPVETTATALSNGWCWKIPLTNRFGNGYVYSSDFINSEQAETELRQHLNMMENEHNCRHLKMKVGCLETHWQNNCVGLGLAQGFIEPLEATALHLVQICIEMFIDDFSAGNFTQQFQAQYNQKVTERFERVRDYIVAHYKINTRNDSEYWRANRNNPHLSESLIQLLEVWYRREDLEQEIKRQNIESHFGTVSWHCLLAGYGAFPPIADKQPGTGDLYVDQKIKSFLHGCSLNFRAHQHNLERL
ncbi:tryptophan halogenase family protein [Flavobacterium sp. W21_SRS_FM6]|uniref:tryptophan halogenase family protein n=1 Tax=Flavobacterium sp. W21_SRS_FM6 TaxID=3240268 RepID=UPI003F922E8D